MWFTLMDIYQLLVKKKEKSYYGNKVLHSVDGVEMSILRTRQSKRLGVGVKLEVSCYRLTSFEVNNLFQIRFFC